jgi:hypothetical protein
MLDDPRARAYIVDNLAAGTTIQRRISLRNDSDDFQNVRIYAAGARVAGSSFVPAGKDKRNELSRWISPAVENLTIAPHTKSTDLITIAVPKGTSSGERFAAIWAEVRSTSATPGGGMITGVSRVGIRVYLSVGTGSGPRTAFTVTSMHAHRAADDRVVITAKVTNTGGRAIDVNGKLSLTDGPDSLRAGPFALEHVVTLAEGQSGRVSVPLSKGLPRGPWTATITAKSGTATEKLSAKITFPAAGSQHSSLGVIQPPNWWLLIGVIAVLCLIPPAAALSRKRRRARNRAKLSQPKPAIG